LLSTQSTHIGVPLDLHCSPAAQPSVAPKQSTQVLLALQVPFTPVHALAPPRRHTTHAPAGPHAGVAGVGTMQSIGSVATAQPRHIFVVRLQMGVVPEHCALLVHGTQLLLLGFPESTLHAGVLPPQS
jgi:hypothetical protein